MKTDELIHRNKSTIPSDYLFEVPEINIGNMDQKEAATSVTTGFEMIGETETYLQSTASITCIDAESKCEEPKADHKPDKTDKSHVVEKECSVDLCDDTETDEVFETETIPNVQEIRMKELKEFSFGNDENNSTSTQVDAKVADILTTQKRVRLVKAYAWIKEEMEHTTTKNIADHLYQHQPILMSLHDRECIHDAKWRRDAAEVLLKRVLMGPDDIYDVFVNVLRQGGGEHIAEHLDMIEVTGVDIEVFTMLEMSAARKKPRPYFEEPRLTFSKPYQCALKYWLKNKAVVDSINDHFLSRMIFRIDEHTHIADSTMNTNEKVNQLVFTMKLCSEKTLKEFYQILELEAVCMSHVIEKLEREEFGQVIKRQRSKRKSTYFDDDEVIPAKTKRKRNTLCHEKESDIVRTIQKSGSNVKEKALEQLGMVLDGVKEGSIIIQLTPKDSSSWRTLKTSCCSGNIKDFIPEVFRNNTSDMEEGEYMLRFIIYLLPTPPYSKGDKKVMFSLEGEQSTSTYIEECSNVLCQELEITDKLLAILKKEKIVGENIKKDIAKQSRRKRIKHLLDHIAQHGDRGYKILKDYIKTENESLYNELDTTENTKGMSKSMRVGAHITARPGSATQENRKELFYTASVVLLIKKSVEKEKDKGRDDVEITCPRIVRSECHFTDKDDIPQHESDEECLSLNETWSFDTKHQENKEYPEKADGKRKEIEDFDSDQRDIVSESALKKTSCDKFKDKETAVESVMPALYADKSSSNRKEEAINKTGTDVKKKVSKKTK